VQRLKFDQESDEDVPDAGVEAVLVENQAKVKEYRSVRRSDGMFMGQVGMQKIQNGKADPKVANKTIIRF